MLSTTHMLRSMFLFCSRMDASVFVVCAERPVLMVLERCVRVCVQHSPDGALWLSATSLAANAYGEYFEWLSVPDEPVNPSMKGPAAAACRQLCSPLSRRLVVLRVQPRVSLPDLNM
eukprot:3909960-Rhodomonas_salina.1